MDSSPTLPRRASCIGWHCLTASQKFGTIFSIVVFFLFFLILFMFYLGKAKLSYESRNPQRTCNTWLNSANGHAHQHSPSVAQTGQFIGIPVATSYVPYASYTGTVPFAQSMPALSPRAAIWSQHPAIPAPTFVIPATHVMTTQQPMYANMPIDSDHYILPGSLNNVPHQNQPAPQPAPIPVATTHAERMSKGWFQKLQRALKLPSGRASTVASRSPSVASRQRENEAVDAQTDVRMSGVSNGTHWPSGRAGIPSNTNSNASRDDVGAVSVDTAAATVRSDDFETPVFRGLIPSTTSAGLQDNESRMNELSNGIPHATSISEANLKHSDNVTKDEPLPRVSRESRRRAWENKQTDSDVHSASGSSGYEPQAPRAVHQGRVSY